MLLNLPRTSRGKIAPPGIPIINKSHPLAKGLVLAYWCASGAQPLELVSGQPQTVQSGSNVSDAPALGAYGMGRKGGTAGGGASFTAPQNTKIGLPITMFWQGVALGAMNSNYGLIIGGFNTAGGSPFLTYGLDLNVNSGGGALGVFLDSNNAGSFGNRVGGQFWPASYPTPLTLMGTSNSSGSILYKNGKQVTTGITTGNANYTSTSSWSVGYSAYHLTTCAYLWNRNLTPQEAALIDADPFCFLIFPQDRLLSLLTGRLTITGSLALQQAADAAAIAASEIFTANPALSQNKDASAISASEIFSALSGLQQNPDSVDIAAAQKFIATLAPSESAANVSIMANEIFKILSGPAQAADIVSILASYFELKIKSGAVSDSPLFNGLLSDIALYQSAASDIALYQSAASDKP